jgi:hypothetical protein
MAAGLKETQDGEEIVPAGAVGGGVPNRGGDARVKEISVDGEVNGDA